MPLVTKFDSKKKLLSAFLESLHGFISESKELRDLTHSTKRRGKDSGSLRDKLVRQLRKRKAAGEPFEITQDNLQLTVNDLIGYRILHLHTRQMEQINSTLLRVIDDADWKIFEKSKARVWDLETKTYFEGIGMETEYNPRMYSSVHYVFQPKSGSAVTCEVQVRTLSEEIWGEVDHRLNYPHEHESVACSEQIKVLARVASSCTRLVDSIFTSHEDWEKSKGTAES